MWKFIIDNFGVVVLSVLFFTAGVMLGFSIKAKNDGLFVLIHYNDKPVVEIGQHNKNYLNLDLSSLDHTQAKQISAELELLPALDNPLSLELRNMVRRATGPFNTVEKTITFKLVENPRIYGDKGEVCHGSTMFNHAVLAIPPNQLINETRSFKAFVDKPNCKDSELNNIWVSKKYVETWLGKAINEDTIQLTAYLTVTSL